MAIKDPVSKPALPQADAAILDNLWTFRYKQGAALQTGVVRARNERLAFDVVQAWCARAGVRPAARVTPLILADEGILPAAGAVVAAEPGAVTAALETI